MREIVLDTESTGLDPDKGHRVIEIGCVELFNRIPTGKVFHTYLNPERDVPEEAFKIHKLSTEFLKDKPLFMDIYEEFIRFLDDAPLVIHNASFDLKFLNAEFNRVNAPKILAVRATDTVYLARKKFPGSPANLDALCSRFKIDTRRRAVEGHGALLDAHLLAEVYVELLGGNQIELSMVQEDTKINGDPPLKDSPKVILEARLHALTLHEKEAHTVLCKDLKDPLWRLYPGMM